MGSAGNLLKGAGGTVWNATGSGIYGTQVDGGGGHCRAEAAIRRWSPTPFGDDLPGDTFRAPGLRAKLQACVNPLTRSMAETAMRRNFTGTWAVGRT